MTWSKFSDDFSDDCWTLSDTAFRLHVEGLVWNGRKLLDLRLPKEDVRRFAKHPDAAAELVSVGWWTDEGDHYVIRHHGAYQRTREQVLAQQAANTDNGRKGGRPRKPREISELPGRKTQSVTESVSEPETDSVSESQSLSQSKTERDRTGQDRQGSYGSGQDEWPPVVCTTSGHHGCGWQTTDQCRDCSTVVAR